MIYRYADLRPGDVVAGVNLTWRVIHVESASRMLEWQIIPSQLDLTPINPPAKWSPPHTVEEWHAERDGVVRGRT